MVGQDSHTQVCMLRGEEMDMLTVSSAAAAGPEAGEGL